MRESAVACAAVPSASDSLPVAICATASVISSAERVISVARRGGDLSAPGVDPYGPLVLDETESEQEQAGL